MLRLLRHFFLVLLLAIGAEAHDTHVDPDFLLRTWQSEDGLEGNVVRSIAQSTDGFLWVAMAEGIARFDGLEFETIGSGVSYPGRRSGLFRVFTPRNGSVWVSTYLGELLQVVDDHLVAVIVASEEERGDLITRVFFHDGVIYFVRAGRLWSLAGPEPVTIDDPGEGVRRALAADQKRQRVRGREDEDNPATRLIDAKGGVWLVEDGSLHYQAPGQAERTRVISELAGPLEARDLLEDREGTLWIATGPQGLIQVRHSRVSPLVTDEGTYLGPVQCAIQDRDGDWWIGLRSGGVDRIRDGEVSHLELQEGGYRRPASCLFEDSRGTLWLASRDGSVFARNGGSFEPRFSRDPVISQVNAITEDAAGQLWFAGHRGIFRVVNNEVTRLDSQPVLEGAEFSALALAPDGRILAGTIDGRIFSGSDGRFTSLDPPPGLRGWPISAIVALPGDEVWVATIGAGLFLRKEGRWHRFGSEHGMPDIRLTAIAIDDAGDLWLGSLGGILRVSRTELLLGSDDTQLTPRWLRLDHSDGMTTRECVGGSQPGVFSGADGELWFPTSNGIAGVHPREVELLATPPTVHLRSVEIDGRRFSAGLEPLVCGPGRVQLDFNFTGLSLRAPEKVTYRVRLLGLEDEFDYIEDRRIQSYPAVPPGEYTFAVHATNGDGVRSILPAEVTIIVRPHFWETPAFIGSSVSAILLLALATGWVFARRRIQRRLKELEVRSLLEAERLRISRDLHDDLGASLTELSLLSALGAEDPETDNLRPTLDSLSLKSKQVVNTLDEIVWAANPREDSLRSLVDYLAAFSREFLESAQIPLRVEIDRSLPDRPIGPRRRHSIFLTTREALNNAVKHAAPSEIRLRIGREDNKLRITVADDGKGFDLDYAQARGGNGLGNLRQRMAECGGSCSIDSVPGRGTVVDIRLPLPDAPKR